jgi:hypothetical protein
MADLHRLAIVRLAARARGCARRGDALAARLPLQQSGTTSRPATMFGMPM